MTDSDDKKHDLLIERLCETFSVLYQGGAIDKDWLCKNFHITERTAYRDIARLAPVLDEIVSGRYKLCEHLTPKLHVGHLNEFAQFTGVAHLFPRKEGMEIRKIMKNSKFITISGVSSRENSRLESVFNALNQAITQRNEVTYYYRDKPRRVYPYRLTNQNGLWYLVATESQKLKAFEVALIENLNIQDTHYKADPGIIEELSTNHGIRFGFASEITLSVSSHAAEYVTRRALFPAQKIIEQNQAGGLVITTCIRDNNHLFRWLRYWLPDIAIISPLSLREAFERDLRERSITAASCI